MQILSNIYQSIAKRIADSRKRQEEEAKRVADALNNRESFRTIADSIVTASREGGYLSLCMRIYDCSLKDMLLDCIANTPLDLRYHLTQETTTEFMNALKLLYGVYKFEEALIDNLVRHPSGPLSVQYNIKDMPIMEEITTSDAKTSLDDPCCGEPGVILQLFRRSNPDACPNYSYRRNHFETSDKRLIDWFRSHYQHRIDARARVAPPVAAATQVPPTAVTAEFAAAFSAAAAAAAQIAPSEATARSTADAAAASAPVMTGFAAAAAAATAAPTGAVAVSSSTSAAMVPGH